MSIKAVILAAGEGSRMRPLTHNKPKVMLPVANKPLLEHLIIEIAKAGVKDVILVTGYQQEKIVEYFNHGENWGVHIDYCRQPERRGTADAVRMVAQIVNDTFLVMNGDIVVEYRDINKMLAHDCVTIGAFPVEKTEGLGILEVEGENVTGVLEKVENPPSNLANAGVYLFTPEIFQAIADTPLSIRGEYEITKSLQIMIDSGARVTWSKIEKWLDASYPWDLLSVNERLLHAMKTEIQGEIEDGVVIKGSVSVGRGSVVKSGSYIVGPVIIGDNCDIGPNCYIRPSTAIGNGCHIGAAVEVKNSIVMNGTKIPHLTYVGDSVIGENCNLGAGTKVANLKLDKKEISVDGRKTGRRKLGVIMGDNVQTGINTSINVGTMIGSNTFTGPGSLASGSIPEGAKIFQMRNRPVKEENR
jgi:bifunctional UDP-N-acetylglucosamine pyrophosphorylase/glucosamine-1-phosphate N-acetyltransferase